MIEDAKLQAETVVKNKFWIVEQDGKKIATIQSTDDGIVWVDGTTRQKFPSVKILKDYHKISFVPSSAKKKLVSYDVYGYPTSGRTYNELYDVSKHLPIYTKIEKSKSYYCAGYFLIKLGASWTRVFCPKLITLQRYEYQGPFRTEQEQLDRQDQLRSS